MNAVNNKQEPAAVDNILAELKANKPAAASTPGRSVDDILAEMGLGGQGSLLRSVLPRPAAAPSPAQPARAIPQPAAQPVQEARESAGPPPPEEPAPSFVHRPERRQEQAAAENAAPAEPVWEAPEPADGGDTKPLSATAVLRMGKAAAMDWVEPDKFAGDPELSRWFDGGGNLPTNRRERKKTEKELRRRLAEERREEKRKAKELRKGGLPGEGNAYTEAGPTAEETVRVDDTSSFFAPLPEQQPLGEPLPPVPGKNAGGGEVDSTQPFSPVQTAEPGKAYVPDITGRFTLVGDDDEPAAPQGGAGAPPHTAVFEAGAAKAAGAAAPLFGQAPQVLPEAPYDTRSFEFAAIGGKTPSAAFTQEFDIEEEGQADPSAAKNLYLDEMVDDRFREFFGETVSVDRQEIEEAARSRRAKKKKSRSGVITGEFAKLAEMAEHDEAAALGGLPDDYEEEIDDYNKPQDAPAIEGDITALCKTLSRRTGITAVIGVLLLWMSFSFSNGLWLPQPIAFSENAVLFSAVYLGLLAIGVAVNFTTVSTGLAGLFAAPTVDAPPALATLASAAQGAVLLVLAVMKKPPEDFWTLFGGLSALLLVFNAYGKRIRAVSILRSFRLASAGMDHSAAYILNSSNELAQGITKGLEEHAPVLLVSRPTTLVKGFLRQSFSQRGTDRTGKILGWVVFAVGLAAVAVTWFVSEQGFVAFTAASVLAGVLCIAAPLSSSLVSGVPSLLLQRNTARVGAVVPGWSAIEDLGEVNVVMATARDLFPPSAVYLKGIKTFEKERVDIAILYAASVLIEGCDTLRDIFLGVIQGKNDMLYKVESLTKEPGRGFTAWVQNNRVVIGSREMLQRHDIQPPNIEIEMKYVPEGHMPVYLAVGGKLFAMFIVGYGADTEVADTLNGLIKSGVSLLVHSDDMNVTGELIEHAYHLPPGVVKVLGQRELDILDPLTRFVPESEGVMTHIATFASFIGGMRAAAGCAAAEKMASVVQVCSVGLAGALCLLLAFSGGLAGFSMLIALLYQFAWTLLVGILPFMRRY